MLFVALLRGINVGGNNKVEMSKLKLSFEELGFSKVKTYINSGNVIFESLDEKDLATITSRLEKKIEEDFGFFIKVLVCGFDLIKKIVKKLPDDWHNNEAMKCDVMFLWEEIDNQNLVAELPIKKDIDEVIYTKGAILWSIKRENLAKSGIMKLVGTKLYKQMTIRNANTVRKLFSIMSEPSI